LKKNVCLKAKDLINWRAKQYNISDQVKDLMISDLVDLISEEYFEVLEKKKDNKIMTPRKIKTYQKKQRKLDRLNMFYHKYNNETNKKYIENRSSDFQIISTISEVIDKLSLDFDDFLNYCFNHYKSNIVKFGIDYLQMIIREYSIKMQRKQI